MFPPSGDSHWIGPADALDPMTYTVSVIRRGFHGDALPAALVPAGGSAMMDLACSRWSPWWPSSAAVALCRRRA